MQILAIEFASDRRSVAVLADGVVRGQAWEFGGRTTRALTLIARALQEAALEREEIEGLAIGLGPGSYAGIRAAISLAQGWQLARGVRLLGLSTVEGLAVRAQVEGTRGRVNILIDAQRGEFYGAAYALGAGSRTVLEPLRLATREEIQPWLGLGETLVWPELAPQFPEARVLLPDAASLGLLAAGSDAFVPGESLEPIYLRAPSFRKAAPLRVIPPLSS